MSNFLDLLKEKVVVFDGAMGTYLQSLNLSIDEWGGPAFENCSENLLYTRPDAIESVHKAFLDVGCDVIETNSFGGSEVVLTEFGIADKTYDVNLRAAQLAKRIAGDYSTFDKPRFVAGAIGPMNKTLSLSPDVNNPGFRAVTFDEVVASYYEQVKGLLEGGVDILLIETIFDTLNAKGAIFAIKKFYRDHPNAPKTEIMISGTITDASGRTLSGQTLEAFYTSVAHAKPLSVGLNCALGAKEMRPHIAELSQLASCYVSAYPNAGLPNTMGEYDEQPEETAHFLEDWANEGFVNIVGGCCGTTPDHIRHIADHVKNITPRPLPVLEKELA